MLTFIIFSYNRAMQLDALLRSMFQYCQIKPHVVVLYNCTDGFQNGYELLKKNWPQVSFRKEHPSDQGISFLFPWTFSNLRHFMKHPYLRRPKTDFRSLLLEILHDAPDEHIAFLTDDSIFVEPFGLPEEAAKQISNAPMDVSFSLRLGTNISLLSSWEDCDGEMIRWDYDDPKNRKDWRYYFSVDGHVYAKQSLVRLCDRVLFCNPNSLEPFAFDYVRRNHWYRTGLAYKHSKLLSFPVNIVQKIEKNESLSLSLEFLEEKLLAGWHLQYPYQENTTVFQNYPDHVRLCKDGEADLIVKTSPETANANG